MRYDPHRIHIWLGNLIKFYMLVGEDLAVPPAKLTNKMGQENKAPP